MLYVLPYWEIRRIIRGYRQRDRFKMELIRLQAYCSYFGMRENREHLSPRQWMTLPWEREEMEAALPDDDEIEQMQREMEAMNKENGC